MCGISVCLGAAKDEAFKFVQSANQFLRHRGPDDEGVFVEQDIALSHRRLSIIDLSAAGHQPMISPNGNLIIVFNGEIYNHRELRKAYCGDWDFRSSSDTETIIALYSRMGIKAFEKMVGMWALAIWNKERRQLIISRDRYGQKPLYWKRFEDGSLRFSSEIRPLLHPEKNILYPTAVAEFLALGNYGHLGERTFFRDIFHFPQGSYSIISPDQIEMSPKAYWSFPMIPDKDKRPFDARMRSRVRETIDEAVRSQLLADVRIGATLSGGLDSTVVVGLMARHLDVPFPVFTAQTKGSKYDESKYVHAVEEQLGSKISLHWKELITTRLSETLYPTIKIQEEPFGDPSIIAHGFLMDAAKEAGVPVILGGQGSDELFFGYGNMTSGILSSELRKGRMKRVWKDMNHMHFSYPNRLRVALSSFFPDLELKLRKKSRREKRSWLSRNLNESIEEEFIQLSNSKNVNEIWRESVYGVHLPHLIHYDDRNAMARSIEGRMPFLDHRIAEVITQIQPEYFLQEGKSKMLLRAACEDVIPPLILNRRDKIGFYTPLHEMVRKETDWFQGLLRDDLSRSLDLFDLETLENDFSRIRNTTILDNNVYLRIWRSVAVRVWAELFKVAPAQ